MNERFISSSIIDFEDALYRFCGNEALFRKLVMKFPNDHSFEELKTALNANDTEAALLASHTLKGVSGNLSLVELYDLSSIIHDTLRSENPLDPHLITQTQAAYDRVCYALQEL